VAGNITIAVLSVKNEVLLAAYHFWVVMVSVRKVASVRVPTLRMIPRVQIYDTMGCHACPAARAIPSFTWARKTCLPRVFLTTTSAVMLLVVVMLIQGCH
jgi:hypothetical protein